LSTVDTRIPKISEIANDVVGALEVSRADRHAMADIDPLAYQLFVEENYFYNRRADGNLARASAAPVDW